jgi:glycosyltransferase involved in cell wall biosynthesis
MPNAPVEAMAAGLPVVGCAASGVHDIFESGEHSGGIIVSVGDIDAFAKALGRALDDKQLAFQLSKNAKIRAQLFSQETIGARLESVLFGHQMEARSNTIGS